MQIIITDAWMARSKAIHLSGARLLLAGVLGAFLLVFMSLGMYHWVFLKGAREGWPVVGSLVRLVVKDEFEQRDRFMRENLDLLARRLGEMQAKLTQLESLGERVSGLAGMNPAEIRIKPGQGGLSIPGRSLTLQELEGHLDRLDALARQRADWFTVAETRLFDQKVKTMLVPTRQPVVSGNLGSLFGWRIDPLTGTSALHTGLDYPAEVGTPILAAAGGVVVVQEFSPQYGNMVEIDHGNDLITRYAHASRVLVRVGDLIRVGQKIAEVGNTGRSTGPHLHFEVLVQGVPQDPMKFLDAGRRPSAPALASGLATNQTVALPAASSAARATAQR
ncbi:MAG: M23 family metallopeptidase [Rhodoferax sp.]|nr:M23 family metallopeptidase [Rhodoferax sp.]